LRAFDYKKMRSVKEVLGGFTGKQGRISPSEVRFLAGGTTLVDLLKLEVETPRALIDLNALPYGDIEVNKDGRLKIGALVRNSDLAHNETIQALYTVLSQALLSGASAQLRNKATTAGNLLQRTRCTYFRDPTKPCNKRVPGSGCPAIEGFNRNLAILGTSEHCIATNPSDMNVALRALEAQVHVLGAKGERVIDIGDFHLLPGTTPHKETLLQPGDLITHVSLPAIPAGTKQIYLKLRDRASYEFALASAAVLITMQGGLIKRARIAMGGIATKPWRVPEAENLLEGSSPSGEKFRSAAELLLRGAKPQSENSFKVELAKRCLTHALTQAAKG
jgi:xanthine dehydrogenase YagS FAD-binding subunit